MATQTIFTTTTIVDNSIAGSDGDLRVTKDELPRSHVSGGAKSILMDCLIRNEALNIPHEIAEGALAVEFTPEIRSFMPTPMKMTESVSALWACIGLFAASIAQKRDHVQQQMAVQVDVQAATLMLASLALIEIGGKGIADADLAARVAHLDKGHIGETYRAMATNM